MSRRSYQQPPGADYPQGSRQTPYVYPGPYVPTSQPQYGQAYNNPNGLGSQAPSYQSQHGDPRSTSSSSSRTHTASRASLASRVTPAPNGRAVINNGYMTPASSQTSNEPNYQHVPQSTTASNRAPGYIVPHDIYGVHQPPISIPASSQPGDLDLTVNPTTYRSASGYDYLGNARSSVRDYDHNASDNRYRPNGHNQRG